MYHVARCSHVTIPAHETDAWQKIEAKMHESMELDDVLVTLSSDEAVATWLTYAADRGDFTEYVQVCDTDVTSCKTFEHPNKPECEQ